MHHNPMVTNVALWVFGICVLTAIPPLGVLCILFAFARQARWANQVAGVKRKRERRAEQKQIQHEIRLWKSI